LHHGRAVGSTVEDVTASTHPPEVPYAASERDMLGAFLDALRGVAERKLDGLTEAQARSAPTASTLCLLGIVRHLAWAEHRWFERAFADPPVPDSERVDIPVDEFQPEPGDSIESVRAFYRAQCGRSRAITAGAVDLDALGINPRLPERQVTLRWALVHMIEETARHAGHADIIRETIDGRTGD
jgi:hypothetical protein